MTDEEVAQQLQDEARKRGVTYDPSDLEDVRHRDNTPDALAMELRKYDTRATNTPNQDAGGAQSMPAYQGGYAPAQAWNNNAQTESLFPSWYKDLLTQQVGLQQSQAAENKSRADALYSTLQGRASQGLNINAQDPIISGQVNAFRAEQERAKRNYLADTAEQGGAYTNLQREQRMGAEKVGQSVSGFQAELLQRELMARREEIVQALASQGAMLSGDQQRNLAQQIAAYDQAIKQAQTGLGVGSLNLQQQGLAQNQDQFLRELGLRQWQLGDQSDYLWSTR